MDWQVAGFGGFSSNPSETDMMLRNKNTGAFQVYDISNNMITNCVSVGTVGNNFVVAGFGDFSGNPGESDMLMRNASTGAFQMPLVPRSCTTSPAISGSPRKRT